MRRSVALSRGKRLDLAGCGPTRFDRARGRAARGHRHGIRAHPGTEARAEPDLRHGRRQGLLARLRLRRRAGQDRVPAAGDRRARRRDRRRGRRGRRHDRAAAERFGAGRVAIGWDGRDDDGSPLPEGEYRPRVQLREDRRTIVLPNPIQIDVTPAAPREDPTLASRVLARRRSAPRPGHCSGTASTSRVARCCSSTGSRAGSPAFRADRATSLVWNGKVDGRALRRPGSYRLGSRARSGRESRGQHGAGPDRAPLRGARPRPRPRRRRGAVSRSASRQTRRRVRWTLGRRSGFARPGTLRIRAPRQKGRFTLRVSANGHRRGRPSSSGSRLR